MVRSSPLVMMASLVSFIFLLSVPFCGSFTLETFSDGSPSKEHTFPAGGGTTSQNAFQLEIERGVTIESASFYISGGPDQNGNYPTNVTLDVGNDGDEEWEFKGTGKGHFGHQDVFSDGLASKTVTFAEGGSEDSRVQGFKGLFSKAEIIRLF